MDDFVFFKTWEIQLFNPYHKSRLTVKYSNNLSHEVDNCLEFHAIETMLTKFFVEHQVFRRFSVIFAHQGSRGIKTLFSRQALRRNCATARAGNVRACGAASSTPGQVAGRQGGGVRVLESLPSDMKLMKFAWNCTLIFCVFLGDVFLQSCGIILWKWSAHWGLKIATSGTVLLFPSNSTTWISVCQFHRLVCQNDCLNIRDPPKHLAPVVHCSLHFKWILLKRTLILRNLVLDLLI